MQFNPQRLLPTGSIGNAKPVVPTRGIGTNIGQCPVQINATGKLSRIPVF